MKTKILNLIILLGLILAVSGCEKKVFYYDDYPPSVPKGLSSITGDERVYLFWYENDEYDFDEYWVYRRRDDESHYRRIGISGMGEYVDRNVANGRTYWYRVSAWNWHGEESELSEPTYDTPRPEGWNQIIKDFNRYPSYSGFDLSRGEAVPYDDPCCDIYLEYYDEVFYLWVNDEDTYIQDFGFTEDIDDLDYSPVEGWSAFWDIELIKGHSYIIWTWDNHFAKIRVEDFTSHYGMLFDWAYQVDPGNQELKPRPPKITIAKKEKEKKENNDL